MDDSNDINIYFDDVLVDPADYSVTMPNRLIFDVAPDADVVITGDYQFFYVCRFAEDQIEFKKFMDRLWDLQECGFRSIIQ